VSISVTPLGNRPTPSRRSTVGREVAKLGSRERLRGRQACSRERLRGRQACSRERGREVAKPARGSGCEGAKLARGSGCEGAKLARGSEVAKAPARGSEVAKSRSRQACSRERGREGAKLARGSGCEVAKLARGSEVAKAPTLLARAVAGSARESSGRRSSQADPGGLVGSIRAVPQPGLRWEAERDARDSRGAALKWLARRAAPLFRVATGRISVAKWVLRGQASQRAIPTK
jgi:hypothetical protein